MRRDSTLLLAAAILMTTACNAVESPANTAEVTDFKILYAENCSGCHGVEGKNGPGRPLNDPLLLAIMPKEALKDLVTNGRPGTAMPAFLDANGGPLTQHQVDALVNGIEQNWAKPVDFHGAMPPAYSANATGDPTSGRKLFAKDCFMCHGPGAKVGPVTEPSYLALASDQYLRTSIIVGRRDMDMPMPNWQYLNLGKPLSEQDIADVVAYVSSKRPAYSPLAQNSAQSGQMTKSSESPSVEEKQGGKK
jgi:cytochrome c oxidase cbb3-type subunit 3